MAKKKTYNTEFGKIKTYEQRIFGEDVVHVKSINDKKIDVGLAFNSIDGVKANLKRNKGELKG